MTQQSKLLLCDISSETWKEELARAKKYKEATQKHRTEKLMRKEIDKVKKHHR